MTWPMLPSPLVASVLPCSSLTDLMPLLELTMTPFAPSVDRAVSATIFTGSPLPIAVSDVIVLTNATSVSPAVIAASAAAPLCTGTSSIFRSPNIFWSIPQTICSLQSPIVVTRRVLTSPPSASEPDPEPQAAIVSASVAVPATIANRFMQILLCAYGPCRGGSGRRREPRTWLRSWGLCVGDADTRRTCCQQYAQHDLVLRDSVGALVQSGGRAGGVAGCRGTVTSRSMLPTTTDTTSLPPRDPALRDDVS